MKKRSQMISRPIEEREPDEAALTAEMIAILRRKMARDYAKGGTLRDAHPKTVGLLRGRFRIEPGLPEALRVGLFEKPRSFDCWVRFSNSSGKVQSDAVPDARGVAIKLLAPRGKGSTAGAELGQDFVLLDTPVMPLGTVALFRDAVYYTIESTPLLLAAKFALTGHAGVLLGLLKLRGNPSSPLDIQYWSTTPYRFGPDRAVKYSLRPTSRHKSRKPATLGESYLSEAMQAHLDGHEATLRFLRAVPAARDADRGCGSTLGRSEVAVPEGGDAASAHPEISQRQARAAGRGPVLLARACPARARAAGRTEPRTQQDLRGTVQVQARA